MEKRGGKVATGIILGYAVPTQKAKKVTTVKQASNISVWSSGFINGKANSYATIKIDD